MKKMIALGFEGSANKIGVGVTILVPSRETAQHHLQHVHPLIKSPLETAQITPKEIDCFVTPRVLDWEHHYNFGRSPLLQLIIAVHILRWEGL
ncbi:unnamed protein product [Prunus brigantina]